MNDSAGGCLAGTLMVIVHIMSFVISGILAWNWIEPNSFGGAILFVAAWGIMGYFTDLALGAVVGLIIILIDKLSN